MVKDEYTLVLVKPDGVKTRHIGDIITRIERKGYNIEALKMIDPSEEKLRQHYFDKVDKPFFPELLEYMTEGPIVGIVVSGTNVIQAIHNMAGATNPGEAEWGTIRGDYGREWPDGNLRNIIHTSDNVNSATREIGIWFPEFDIKVFFQLLYLFITCPLLAFNFSLYCQGIAFPKDPVSVALDARIIFYLIKSVLSPSTI